MAMAGAIVSPRATTVLFRDEAACSTSCRASHCSFAPQARPNFLPLLRPTSRCHRSISAQGLSFRPSESRLLCRSGLSFITSWHGRSHLGEIMRVFEGRQSSECSGRGLTGRVYASLLGVGAPEVFVIAVVALLVFGPKGLAEVARTLGKSLKAFQPALQELQQVSKEFKSTLESEIGLDELRNPRSTDMPPTYQQAPPQQFRPEQQAPLQQAPSQQDPQEQQPSPNGAVEAKAYTTDDYLRVTKEQIKGVGGPESLLRETEVPTWGRPAPPDKTAENVETKEDANEPEKPKDES